MAKNYDLKWYGRQRKKEIESEYSGRITACCILLVNYVRISVSKAYPPASSPGQPPAKRTGRLRASYAWEMISEFVGRVGTNLTYGRALEIGSRRVRARPHLRPALAAMTPKIRAILSAPIDERAIARRIHEKRVAAVQAQARKRREKRARAVRRLRKRVARAIKPLRRAAARRGKQVARSARRATAKGIKRTRKATGKVRKVALRRGAKAVKAVRKIAAGAFRPKKRRRRRKP